MSDRAERSGRVSTLELFFDLVFVFTITQLTGVLVDGEGAAAVVQVVVMLALIWWMYDAYAWLTNAISTDRLRFRLLLIGGMGGFLVIALPVPEAYAGDGVAFGLGYLVVVLLHTAMFVHGTSISEVRAILRIAPFSFVGVTLILVGASLGGDWQWALWAITAGLLWVTPHITSTEGFVVAVSHFVERHGLVVIVALGESIVVIGAGAAGLPLDGGLVLVALLALSLSAALWWVYFSDEAAVERAFHDTPPERRADLALRGSATGTTESCSESSPSRPASRRRSATRTSRCTAGSRSGSVRALRSSSSATSVFGGRSGWPGTRRGSSPLRQH